MNSGRGELPVRRHTLSAEVPMPCPNGIGRDRHHRGHLLRFVSQVQQTNGNRPLPYFGMGSTDRRDKPGGL